MNKMHKWIEYPEVEFKSKVYIPLMDTIAVKHAPVLMGRVEFGLLGHYNKYKKSPFETFDVGGDGGNDWIFQLCNRKCRLAWI